MVDKNEILESLKGAMGDRIADEITILDKNDKFDFKCKGCGECCTSDACNQILMSPLDMYNGAKALGMSTGHFFKSFCETYIGENSNFPVVRLKPRKVNGPNGQIVFCPLLDKNKKCKVHSGKPSICSLYPLGRMVSSNDKTLESGEIIYFLQKSNCDGKGKLHTIDEWIKNTEDQEYMMKKSQFVLTKLYRKIDFDKYIKEMSKVMNDVDKESFDKRIKDINNLFSLILTTYYFNYSIEKSFREQLERNIENLEEAINMFKACFNC